MSGSWSALSAQSALRASTSAAPQTSLEVAQQAADQEHQVGQVEQAKHVDNKT